MSKLEGYHWSRKPDKYCKEPLSGKQNKYRVTYDGKYTFTIENNSYYNAREECKVILNQRFGISEMELSKLIIVQENV